MTRAICPACQLPAPASPFGRSGTWHTIDPHNTADGSCGGVGVWVPSAHVVTLPADARWCASCRASTIHATCPLCGATGLPVLSAAQL